MDDDEMAEARTGAESVLTGLKRAGIDWLFANAGTDFPPVIEALARLPADMKPTPVTVPHESVAMGMAHGHYLVTGRPQAVMVHVNVGLANATMGLLNAASDNVPVILLSGRTPLTERGRRGGRVSPIQYGQEMYDQTALVREATKFQYELRYPEQGAELVQRAVTLAVSAPEAPVYLSLPREPLMEAVPEGARVPSPGPATRPAAPDAEAVGTVARWLATATSPLILCQRGDVAGHLGPALSDFGRRHGIGIAEPFVVRNVLASDDPCHLGPDAGAALDAADVVVVLDSGVPWIASRQGPAPDARVVHVGADPNFARMPVRGYRSDLSICADPTAFLTALNAAMPDPDTAAAARFADLRSAAAHRRQAIDAQAASGRTAPMSDAWMSACLSDAMDDDAVVFSELGVVPDAMRLRRQNQLFNTPHSGGLGWAFPAALGAQLADRDRLVIAAMGDGSYLFANPVACHQVAEALGLPVLVVVKNNAMWNAVRRSVVGAYPEGAAARANEMPLTSLAPQPDFCAVARASRAHAERVEDGDDLPEALARALHAVRTERRAALLDIVVAVSETQ